MVSVLIRACLIKNTTTGATLIWFLTLWWGGVAQGRAYVYVVVISTLQPNEARELGELDVSCNFSLGNVFSGCIVCISFGVVVQPTENSLIWLRTLWWGVVAQGRAYVYVVVISTLQPNEAREPGELDVSCNFPLGNVFSSCIVCTWFGGFASAVLITENSLISASGDIGEKVPTVAFTLLRYDPEPKADMALDFGDRGVYVPNGSINPQSCWLIWMKRC